MTRYDDRLAAGLCAECGVAKHQEGRTRCVDCAERARQAAALRREIARRRGLCEACMRTPRAPGRGNRCRPCADKYLRAQLERDHETGRRRIGAA